MATTVDAGDEKYPQVIYKNMIIAPVSLCDRLDCDFVIINKNAEKIEGQGQGQSYNRIRLNAEIPSLNLIECKFSDTLQCNVYYFSTNNSDNNTSNEEQYLSLLKELSAINTIRTDRTGTGTHSLFGRQLRFNIAGGRVPVLTTKYVNWRSVVVELIWFLSGSTNTNFLHQNDVHIWDGNSSREFLDSRGLDYLPEGNIGLGYGYQWRNFNGNYVDQITDLIKGIRNDPYGRRHILTAWNPAQLHKMALPPCHCFAQFYVSMDNQLSCHMYQRSVDVFLGLPFNILSYTILTYLIAIMTDLKPYELIISTGDTHIYSNHLEQVNIELSRKPYNQPILIIDEKKIKASENLKNISVDDINIIGYLYHPYIKADMAI